MAAPIAEDEPVVGATRMPRNGSWLWDWKQSPPGSTNSSKHGGKLFGGMFGPSPPGSRNSSKHGGTMFSEGGGLVSVLTPPERSGSKMSRNASFSDLSGGMLTDDPSRQTPRSREASGHGGSLFAKAFPRTNSFLWDWRHSPVDSANTTPNSSRNASKHGGQLFESMVDGGTPGTASPKMKRNASFMWDWSKYRGTPPQTPNASLHGGSAFAPEAEPPEGDAVPAIEPPVAMRRNMSLGSFMWSWGAQRETPSTTPNSSLHGGDAWTHAKDQNPK